MVGGAGVDGAGAVDLFEEEEEGEFVLECEFAEGETKVGCDTEGVGVAVCSANEEGDGFGALHFPLRDAGGEF